MRMFGKEMSETEKKELILKAYKQLKMSFERFVKPDGTKQAPAKTCRDLAVAYPHFGTGKQVIRMY